MENGILKETAASLADAVPEDLRQTFQHPSLAIDGNGNPWLFFRTRVNLPVAKGSEARQFRAMWRLQASTWRNGGWTPPLGFTHGGGRLHAPSAVAPRRR